MDELLADEEIFEYDFQLYECLFRKWIRRDRKSFTDENGEEMYNECLQLAKSIYYQWENNGRAGIYFSELNENSSVSELASVQLKGHAMLNRTKDGLYKFSHKSYWEYMLARLALSDIYFSNDLSIKNFERTASFLEEMTQYYQKHEDEQTFEICTGIAIYLKKCKKYEGAEQLLHKACDMYKNQESNQKSRQMDKILLSNLIDCLEAQSKNVETEILEEYLILITRNDE